MLSHLCLHIRGDVNGATDAEEVNELGLNSQENQMVHTQLRVARKLFFSAEIQTASPTITTQLHGGMMGCHRSRHKCSLLFIIHHRLVS